MLGISTAQTFASNWLAAGSAASRSPGRSWRCGCLRPTRWPISPATMSTSRSGWGPGRGRGSGSISSSASLDSALHPEFRDRHRLERPGDLLRVARLNAQWWKQWLEEAGVPSPTRRRGRASGSIRRRSKAMPPSPATASACSPALLALRARRRPARPAVRPGRRQRPGPVARLPRAKRGRAKIRAFRDWLLAEIAADAPAGPAEAFTPPEAAPAG